MPPRWAPGSDLSDVVLLLRVYWPSYGIRLPEAEHVKRHMSLFGAVDTPRGKGYEERPAANDLENPLIGRKI